MDITAHLKRSRHRVFYCRFRLRSPGTTPPSRLQISEIAHSLATKNRREAIALSYPINTAVHALVHRARACGASHETTLMELRNQLHQWTARIDSPERSMTFKADPSIPNDTRDAIRAMLAMVRSGVDLDTIAPQAGLPEPSPHTVQAAIKTYLQTDGRELAPKSLTDYRLIFSDFDSWLQKRSITTLGRITGPVIVAYKDYLRGEKKHGAKTVNKKLSAVKMLLLGAQRRGMFAGTEEMFRGLHFNKKEERRETRSHATFSDEQLRLLFHNLRSVARTPHEFWAPVLALLHGFRGHEIAQLQVTDFRTANGVAYIDVNNDGEGKRLKTDAAKRQVPLHPALVALNIHAYLDDLRQHDHTRLFPYLRIDKATGTFSDVVSEGVNRLIKRQIKSAQGLTLHGLRGTANDAMKQAGVGKELREELLGHEDTSVNALAYSEDYGLSKRAGAIAKIPVPFDIQALAYKKGDFVQVLAREMRAAPRRMEAARKRAQRAVVHGAHSRANTDTTDAIGSAQ
jgi:integrase